MLEAVRSVCHSQASVANIATPQWVLDAVLTCQGTSMVKRGFALLAALFQGVLRLAKILAFVISQLIAERIWYVGGIKLDCKDRFCFHMF